MGLKRVQLNTGSTLGTSLAFWLFFTAGLGGTGSTIGPFLSLGISSRSDAATNSMQSVTSLAATQDRPLSEPKKEPVEKTILFVGDSIADGYGVKRDEAFPQQVGDLLRAAGHQVKIVNGSISGSVTADADRRLKWYLKIHPDLVVLELGGNDALSGTSIPVIKANLGKAIDLAQASGIRVVLAGMKIYSNYGPTYREQFEAMYKELAKEKKLVLIPFLLEGVALNKQLMQADGKHPNPKGHALIAKKILPVLEPLL